MPNSKSLSIPEELLNLEDIKIIESKLTSDNTIVIKVESTKKEILCHQCGGICESHGKGTTIKLRHLPILGRKTYIELTPPRGICRKCDKNRSGVFSSFQYKGYIKKKGDDWM